MGKEGLKLYELAVEEESRSPAFRAAVFKSSTKAYDGPQWNKKLILWVGGPSASGKTFSATKAVEQMSRYMPINLDNDAKNYVVSVDGAIEREVSQMRQLVLQAALLQGYKGIEDLHNVTKKQMDIKTCIMKAALHQEGISLVIPETFVESKFRTSNRFRINDMKDFHQRKNVVQAFAEVVGHPDINFKSTVACMGNSRAWLEKEKHFERKNIKINNRNIGCESKAYDGMGFKWGVSVSQDARENFKKINPEGRYIKITNDIVFAHKHDGQWKMCGEGDTPQVKLSKRDFDKWQKTKSHEIDLDEWYKNEQNKAPVLIEDTCIGGEAKHEKSANKSFGFFSFQRFIETSPSIHLKDEISKKSLAVEEKKSLLSESSDEEKEKDSPREKEKGSPEEKEKDNSRKKDKDNSDEKKRSWPGFGRSSSSSGD